MSSYSSLGSITLSKLHLLTHFVLINESDVINVMLKSVEKDIYWKLSGVWK